MKRFILAAFAAALLIPVTGAVSARAQDDGPGAGDHAGPPPEMGEKMAAKMKEKLGLSDDQAAKLKDAFKAHGDAMKPLGKQMKELLEKLHKQVEDKASDGDLKATLDALKASRKSMADAQESFHATLAGFLTPTQQAKFVLGAAAQMRHRMGGRGGRGGRGGHGDRMRGHGDDDKGGDQGGGKKDDGDDD